MHKRLALTPPMGWNSWDCYGAAVNEEQLLANADYMAKHLKDYGWEYVICDIQWSEPTAKSFYYNYFAPLCMDEYSRLIPSVERFPSSAGGKGFKPIADYIHSLGLKFGIHIMRGIPRQAAHQNTKIKCEGVTARDIAHPSSICGWNPDMYGLVTDKKGAQEYYDSIFELYASWEKDIMVEEYMVEDAEVVIASYGISARIAKSAVEICRKAGKKVGLIRPITVHPFPYAAFDHINYDVCKAVLDVEMSIPAQLVQDVNSAVMGRCPIETCLCSGGNIMSRQAVLDAVDAILSK